jgi:N-acetylglucosaminyldiphosphoundecaprenol N-acetyl-beta-D-mannosaminyltransferase
VVWAGRLLGRPLPERVTGIDLMERLLATAERHAWPVFFYGARPEALERFVAEVERRHPGLPVAGTQHGYADDPAAVAARVSGSGARLLFVGISSPFKERFLAEHLPRMSLFAMGVGGAFDVWAGRTRRAPRWMQRGGLEWLYRLLQEPRRMWRRYLLGNVRFAWLVLRARLGFRDSLA